MSTETDVPRPYMGPAPFEKEHKDKFFGRDQDIEILRSMLRTERIVVLHSLSGAGKTSLVQAGLIPRMEDKFKVIWPIRVNHRDFSQSDEPRKSDPYSLSIVDSIESILARDSGGQSTIRNNEALHDVSLASYFDNLSVLCQKGKRLLLVFDQFEEIFTLPPHNRQKKLQFFSELGTVLQNRTIWALFAIREEYVGALDGFSRLVPTQFNKRYHLGPLTFSGAEDAIRKPVERLGWSFEEDALKKILKDLTCPRNTDLEEEDTCEELFQEILTGSREVDIDPMHLQLVCVEVWNNASSNPNRDNREVTADAVADQNIEGELITAVDAALIHYYDNIVKEAAEKEKIGIPEREIREWIEDEFIGAENQRRWKAAEKNRKPLRANYEALEGFLEKHHIIRGGLQTGSTWYELAHDRLVRVIIRSNDWWYNANLSWFQLNARDWKKQGKLRNLGVIPVGILLKFLGNRLMKRSKDKPQYSYEMEFFKLCWKHIYWGIYVLAFSTVLPVAIISSYGAYKKINIKNLNERIESLRLENKTQMESLKTMKDDYNETKNLQEKTQKELEKTQKELGDTKVRGEFRRLQGAAMQQTYVSQNHDVAVLLGLIAKNEIISKNKETPDPHLEEFSRLDWDRAIWAALEARPFCRTIPGEFFGGKEARAQSLMLQGKDIFILVQNSKAWNLATLDLQEPKLKPEKACFAEEMSSHPYLSNDGQYQFKVEHQHLQIRHRSDCEKDYAKISAPAEYDFRNDIGPVLSPDQRYLVAVVEKAKDVKVAFFERTATTKQHSEYRCLGTEPWPTASEVNDVSPTLLVAFYKDLVAMPDAGKGVKFFELGQGKVSSKEPKPAIKYPPAGNTKKTRKNDIIAIAMNPVEEDLVLTTVHRGDANKQHGYILRSRVDNQALPFIVVPDEDSRTWEKALRERYNLPKNREGEAFQTASFGSDNRWLVTGGKHGTVMLWDLVRLDEAVEQSDKDEVSKSYQVESDKSKHKGFVAPRRVLLGMKGAAKSVLSTAIENKKETNEPQPLDIDERVVLAADAVGNLRIWELSPPSESYLVKNSDDRKPYMYALAFLSDSKLLTSDNDGRVDMWPVEKNPSLNIDELSPKKWAKDINLSIRALDIKEDLLALATWDGYPTICSLVDNGKKCESLGSLHSPKAPGLWSVAFRPGEFDGSNYDLATGDAAGKLKFWNLESTRFEKEMKLNGSVTDDHLEFGKDWEVESLAFHPQGRWLLVGTMKPKDGVLPEAPKGGLYLVDMEGRICRPPSDSDHGKPCISWELRNLDMPAVYSVTFSKDGSRFAASGNFGMVRWWKFNESEGRPIGEEIGEEKGTALIGAAGRVRAVRFLPGDASLLIAVGHEGLKIWRLNSPNPGDNANPLSI